MQICRASLIVVILGLRWQRLTLRPQYEEGAESYFSVVVLTVYVYDVMQISLYSRLK